MLFAIGFVMTSQIMYIGEIASDDCRYFKVLKDIVYFIKIFTFIAKIIATN
jgi:hypothetical protein